MPSGKVHARITKTVAIVTAPVILVSLAGGWVGPEVLLAEVGILLTLMASPDLDIHNSAGVLGEFIGFDTYKMLVPHRAGLRKRHWTRLRLWQIALLSHIPWLGTAIRTLMIWFMPLMIALLLGWRPDREQAGLIISLLFWCWVGMGWSDLFHVAGDIIDSDLKELKRKFWDGGKEERERYLRKLKRLRARFAGRREPGGGNFDKRKKRW